MPDFTSMSGPIADPTSDPNGVAFSTLDTAGLQGSPGLTLCTLKVGAVLTKATSGLEHFTEDATPTDSKTAWLPNYAVAQYRQGGTII